MGNANLVIQQVSVPKPTTLPVKEMLAILALSMLFDNVTLSTSCKS